MLSDDLKRVKAVIADENHWTTRALARSRVGLVVCPKDPNAEQWCSVGAIAKVGDVDMSIVKKLDYAAMIVAGESNIVLVNDTSDHDVVMKVFDKAIENAMFEELMQQVTVPETEEECV